MYRFFVFLFLTIFFQSRVTAQITPSEGSALHYVMVGFSVPQTEGFSDYTFQIARGDFNNEDSFRSHIVLTLKSKTTKIIGTLPYWGCRYTWRVVSNASGKSATGTMHGKLMHFSTLANIYTDTSIIRLHVTTRDKLHKDGFIFTDYNKVLYDINGVPVWFLPAIDNIDFERAVVRDLKFTPQGTITLIMNDMPYEINYNGKVLWKAPNNGKVSGDSIEYYHHEFTRLANGHYVALGSEKVLWEPKVSTNEVFLRDNKKIPFGTVIEYDEQGNVVWSWKSSEYYRKSYFYYDTHEASEYDIHENAFCFDERNKAVYVSFKNISQIVKIGYPAGKILNTYGNGLFCLQHNCRKSTQGYLYLFNNNSCSNNPKPKITILQEPATQGAAAKKIWEFDCPTLATNMAKDMKPKITNGGAVTELADRSLFVSSCSPYADMFIVNRSKKITWYAVPEKWDTNGKKWFVLPQYRTSITEHRKELERVIWHE